jgi:hypothetical protein
MQRAHRWRPKSRRHVHAAQCRWRAAEYRADIERDAGIPDREPYVDARQPITLDLRSYGGQRLRIEPRLGYHACRAIGDAGEVVACAAMKALLHQIADSLPRTLAPRHVMGA